MGQIVKPSTTPPPPLTTKTNTVPVTTTTKRRPRLLLLWVQTLWPLCRGGGCRVHRVFLWRLHQLQNVKPVRIEPPISVQEREQIVAAVKQEGEKNRNTSARAAGNTG